MFYELRQYTIKPGCMAEWVEFMEQEVVPFQISKGMLITGMYRGEQDDSLYVWMRGFDSEAQQEALYEAVYESDYWKNEISPRVDQLLDRESIKVLRIVPTPKSTAQ